MPKNRYQASLIFSLCIICSIGSAAPRSLIACFEPIDSTDKRFVPFCVARIASTSIPQGANMVSQSAMKKIVALAFAGLATPSPPQAGSYKTTGQADAQPDVAGIIGPEDISSIVGVVIEDLRNQGKQAPDVLCQLRKDINSLGNS
ncbi:hypothetical protein [Caballeronia concitans]|uniref:hypothetical protein n=1 Tax=Caballeronia concitans TaxID=1777133 RepID=UPI00117FACCE|nr:hypothetical protein [Caballeronia concitans]